MRGGKKRAEAIEKRRNSIRGKGKKGASLTRRSMNGAKGKKKKINR